MLCTCVINRIQTIGYDLEAFLASRDALDDSILHYPMLDNAIEHEFAFKPLCHLAQRPHSFGNTHTATDTCHSHGLNNNSCMMYQGSLASNIYTASATATQPPPPHSRHCHHHPTIAAHNHHRHTSAFAVPINYRRPPASPAS